MKNLIDFEDELSTAKDFVACVVAACDSGPRTDEQKAISAVANAAREKLEAVIEALEEIRRRPGVSEVIG